MTNGVLPCKSLRVGRRRYVPLQLVVFLMSRVILENTTGLTKMPFRYWIVFKNEKDEVSGLAQLRRAIAC